MLTHIVATDADEAKAMPHVVGGSDWISIEICCSTGASRQSHFSITPQVARQLREALGEALTELDDIRVKLAEQRAAVSRDTDNEASETEASHVDP